MREGVALWKLVTHVFRINIMHPHLFSKCVPYYGINELCLFPLSSSQVVKNYDNLSLQFPASKWGKTKAWNEVTHQYTVSSCACRVAVGHALDAGLSKERQLFSEPSVLGGRLLRGQRDARELEEDVEHFRQVVQVVLQGGLLHDLDDLERGRVQRRQRTQTFEFSVKRNLKEVLVFN